MKSRLNQSVPADSPYDVNYDGKVTALDLGAVRANLFRSLTPITGPRTAAAAAATGPAAATNATTTGTLTSRAWDDSDSPLW